MSKCIFKHPRNLLMTVMLAGAGLAVAGNHLLGDVNGDGEVNVTDVMTLTSYILGENPAGFNPKAANLNGDAEINVSDAVGIINLIQTNSVSGSTTSTLAFAETAITKTFGDEPFSVDIYRAGSTGTVSYTSDATDVVTVDASTGEMTVVGAGSAVVTATLAADGSFEEATASINVAVDKATPVVTMTEDDMSLNVGDTDTRVATTTIGTVSYESSDASVATVSSTGLVTAVGAGTATITASVAESANWTTASKTFTVTVTASSSSAPDGAINGKFTINAGGDQVYFAKGNLQATYDGTSWTWGFAENQWDFIGNAAGNTLVTNSSPYISGPGTVDLFGWVGASSTWTGVAQYGITSSTATNKTDGYGNVKSESLKSDWGNTIDASGTTWRTLTKDEWEYVLTGRTTTSVYLFAKATVDGVAGVILLPDDWDRSYYNLNGPGVNSTEFSDNVISSSQWTSNLEAHGAVFLPAAGFRNGTTVTKNGSQGLYHSGTPGTNVMYSYYFSFTSSNLTPAQNLPNRGYGRSVRLVRPVD